MTILIQASNLKVEIKDRCLFHIDNLQIHDNDRIGLVGKNGVGKTTLLHLLANKITADIGSVEHYGTFSLIPQLKETNTTKSGGKMTQAYITAALQEAPALLIADEPTTNLDTAHVQWLEGKLINWQGALLLVSHDREFLDTLCTKIWELKDGKIIEYQGNYKVYTEQKALQRSQHEVAFEQYTKKKQQLEDALFNKQVKANRATKKPKKLSGSEARIAGAKPYFAKKQKKLDQAAKAIRTRIEKLERVEKPFIEKPFIEKPLQMSIPNEETLNGRVVIRAENFGGNVGDRTLWQPTSFHIYAGDHVGIIGPNGSGKTTMLKQIIEGDPRIQCSPAIKIGYFRQNLTILEPKLSILENIQETSTQDSTLIRTVLGRLHFRGGDVHKPISVLSGGERVKVALAKVFLSDVNTLILDEPTNFLDLEAVEAFEELLYHYRGTLLFVSHDRRFLQKLAKRIIAIENSELSIFDGSFDEFNAYQPKNERNEIEDQLLQVENRLAEVLSRLSVEPSAQLDKEFQRLLREKKELQSQF